MAGFLYSLTGLALFAFGLFALIACATPLRKILGVNVMSSGVFLFLVATSYRPGGEGIDPIPHAMVLTGIVVSVSTTAVALTLTALIQPAPDPPPQHGEERARAEWRSGG